MTASESTVRRPVEGEEVTASRSLFIVALVLMVFGLVMFGSRIPDMMNQAGGKGPGTLSFLLGVAGLGAFAYGLFWFLRAWRKNQRLLIGADRVQLLEGEAEVVGELPYDNIAEVAAKKLGKGGPLVFVRLVDPARRGWFWPQPPGFREFIRSRDGFDVMLSHEIGWRESGDVIRKKIQAQRDAWQAMQSPAASISAVNDEQP